MDEVTDPVASLGILSHQQVAITERLDHHEFSTFDGLLTLLWHHGSDQAGAPRSPLPRTDGCAAERAVLFCGGALGGLLGPAGGLFHDLATSFAGQATAAAIRVGYRKPNDIELCVLDVLAAAQLAASRGAQRFVVVGHSFGGAVAIQAGVALAERCAGVVTLATQSGGCEPGEALSETGTPVLLLHGDADQILPFFASQLVQFITGGELIVLPGADHLFAGAGDELRSRLGRWIPERLAAD